MKDDQRINIAQKDSESDSFNEERYLQFFRYFKKNTTRVLNIGCNTGRDAAMLKKLDTMLEISGLDVVEERIKNIPDDIHEHILGIRVGVTTYEESTSQILDWAVNSQSRYICPANVHMVMEAYDEATFRKVVNKADLVTPDGMPLVWMLRRLGHPLEDRVYGPTLMLRIVAAADTKGISGGILRRYTGCIE